MIHHNADEMAAWLQGIGKQIPYATVGALNKLAFQTRTRLQWEIDRAFDTPTPYTRNSIRYDKASISKPWIRIYVNDNARGRGTSPSEYLAQQVFGGARQYKLFERILQKKEYVVPAASAKRNRYGNVSKATVTKVVKALDSGDATKYFRKKLKGGTPGPVIYEKVGRGKKKQIRPIFFITNQPKYRRRFKFFHVGMRVAEKEFERNWQNEFNRIVMSGGRVKLVGTGPRLAGFAYGTP